MKKQPKAKQQEKAPKKKKKTRQAADAPVRAT